MPNILNCPFCENHLTEHPDNKHKYTKSFYCADEKCKKHDRIKMSRCIVHFHENDNEIIYYRFIVNNFIFEGHKNGSTRLLDINSQQNAAKINEYHSVPLHSNWLQELEPVYQKLKLYATFS